MITLFNPFLFNHSSSSANFMYLSFHCWINCYSDGRKLFIVPLEKSFIIILNFCVVREDTLPLLFFFSGNSYVSSYDIINCEIGKEILEQIS